jgi:predicted ATPase
VHLILLGSAYLKYQKRFFSDLVGVDTEFLVSKQIEAQEAIVDQCMDCAWHDSTPDTRQLHLEMELLLVEPDCEISLSQLVRERKLDLIMYASANEIAERLSSLINPHCIGYFFK